MYSNWYFSGKESTCNAEDEETRIWSLGQEDPSGEGNSNSLQSSCLENSMDKGSLVNYSPWCHKELDTNEWLNNNKLIFQYIHIFTYLILM